MTCAVETLSGRKDQRDQDEVHEAERVYASAATRARLPHAMYSVQPVVEIDRRR